MKCDKCGEEIKIGQRMRVDGNSDKTFCAKCLEDGPSVSEFFVMPEGDNVNHPAHYTSGPPCEHCGKPIECITITERMGFRLGNCVKYLWRAGLKGSKLEDLRKAAWYLNREIAAEEKRCAEQQMERA